jgi:exodeoxyribonuclease V alpha subunit
MKTGGLQLPLSVTFHLIRTQRCLLLAGLFRAEQIIAERLRLLANGQPPWPRIEAEKAIQWVGGGTGLALAESQRQALRLALTSKVLVITGGPGVGKTTHVNSILKMFRPSKLKCPCAHRRGVRPSRISLPSIGLWR